VIKIKTQFKKLGLQREAELWQISRGIVFAGAVGIVAGLGAILFHVLRHVVSYWAMDRIAGYRPTGSAGETELIHLVSTTVFRPWLLLFVPAIGGLISGWVVYTFAPETQGHGTDAAIDAYHNKRGIIRARVPFVKMISSVITLGTGGSGGQEGPIAQIGAGFGSVMAGWLKLSDSERRSLMAAGVGAGIGAIFHAPLAGAIFATEVLYRDPDFEAENLIPAFIATTVAYCVYSMVLGFEPLFVVQAMRFDNPYLLMPLTVLAVVMTMASFVFVKFFYFVHRLFERMRLAPVLKPAVGGLATGVLAVGAYYALGALGPGAGWDSLDILSVGYGSLQKLLNPEGSVLLLSVLLIVGIGKILTTSLTIGSGGSAGVFGPSMVIGGTLGAVVAMLFEQFLPQASGWVGVRVDVFVILGMASFFAATANTPVSTLIMVSEMTGSYALLLPAMWVCALAYLLGRGWTIYSEQVRSRVESPAHRGDFVVDVLAGLTVRDVIGWSTRKFKTLEMGMPLADIVRLLTDTRQTCFPVVDAEGRYYGLFGLNDVRQFLYDSESVGELAVAQDLARQDQEPLTLQTDLSSAIGQFASGSDEELPIVDAEKPDKVIGLLRRRDMIAAYSSRLLAMRSSDQERA